MFKVLAIASILIYVSCNANSSSSLPVNTPSSMSDTTKELTQSLLYKAFDTTVQVLFANTPGEMSECQMKTYEGFISKQDVLTPEILNAIFKHYKASYADYKEGWTMAGNLSKEQLEESLPTPTTPENLKPFITPAIFHIPSKSECEEGTFGIEFDCTWDIENGLGILVKNWKVQVASVAEIAYQP